MWKISPRIIPSGVVALATITVLKYPYLIRERKRKVLELSAEIVPNVCIRFSEVKTPNYSFDFNTTACQVTCLKTPHILAPNFYSPSLYHFVHLFYQLIKLVYTRTNRSFLRYSPIIILTL